MTALADGTAQMVGPLLCLVVFSRLTYFLARGDLRGAATVLPMLPLLALSAWLFAIGPQHAVDMLRSAMGSVSAPSAPAPATPHHAAPAPAPAPHRRSSTGDLWWVLAVLAACALLALAVVTVHGRVLARRADATVREAAAVRRAAITLDHDRVREHYGAYLADPLAVLDRPALDNVEDPATVRLLTALDRAADASRSDDLDAYRSAVSALTQAWRAADEHATRTGLTHLTGSQRQVVARARPLISLALDERTPEAEGQQAARTARAQLDGVLVLPAAALAALDHVQRRALPAPRADRRPDGGAALTKP